MEYLAVFKLALDIVEKMIGIVKQMKGLPVVRVRTWVLAVFAVVEIGIIVGCILWYTASDRPATRFETMLMATLMATSAAVIVYLAVLVLLKVIVDYFVRLASQFLNSLNERLRSALLVGEGPSPSPQPPELRTSSSMSREPRSESTNHPNLPCP